MHPQMPSPAPEGDGAGSDWFAATSHPVRSADTLRRQRLARIHLVHPALAPTLAALAWREVAR